jgi:hypothetical protein
MQWDKTARLLFDLFGDEVKPDQTEEEKKLAQVTVCCGIFGMSPDSLRSVSSNRTEKDPMKRPKLLCGYKFTSKLGV